MNSAETTTENLPVEADEKEKIVALAMPVMASIFDIEENKKTLIELVEKHKDAKFTDMEDKDGIKAVGAAYSETRQGRLAVDKLGKNFKQVVKQIQEYGEGQIDELLSIVAPVEKQFKAEKDRIDELKEEERLEKERQKELLKQERIAKLYDLGLTFNGSGYTIGELTISTIEVSMFSTEQFDGFVSQATVVYEAEQVRIAEEARIEAERAAQEESDRKSKEEAEAKEKESLRVANEAKQRELDEAKRLQDEKDAEIAELRALLKAKEVVQPVNPIPPAIQAMVDSGKVELNPANTQDQYFDSGKNGTPIKFTEEPDPFVADMLVAEEAVKQDEKDYRRHTVSITFDEQVNYVDTPIGKSHVFRQYTETFADEANAGLTPENVSASGAVTDELFYLVIKVK